MPISFWPHCGERQLLYLQTQLVLVSFSFSLISTFTPTIHGAVVPSSALCTQLHQLSAPNSEFYEPPSSSDPIRTSSCELSLGFIAIIQENSFSGKDFENPYHHLREFDQVCSCLKISSMTQETLNWKLFPFSLLEDAKQWYSRIAGSVHGN